MNLLILTKPFNSGLKQYMCKAARPSGGVDSLNPRRWRSKWLNHHGGDACCVVLWLCVTVKLIACKKYQNITLRYAYRRLTIRVVGIT
jgi:hypothetical protein